jgi:hypothetical protein
MTTANNFLNENLLEAFCSCKVTNISVMSSETVVFYTQYISPTKFYVITYNKSENISKTGKYYVFIRDSAQNEYVYLLPRSNDRISINKLDWTSSIPLKYSISIKCIENNVNQTCPTSLVHISLETILLNKQLQAQLKELLMTRNIIAIDSIGYNALLNKFGDHFEIAKNLQGKWVCPFDNFSKIDLPIISVTPLNLSINDISIEQNECLLYDASCDLEDSTFYLDKNSWDAIAISTTHYEIEDGRLQSFLEHLLLSISGKYIDKILYIAINKEVSAFGKLEDTFAKCRAHFKDVVIMNLMIDPELDIYITGGELKRPYPKYGCASGPNIMFLNLMRRLACHNTILQLETDCRLKGDWVSRCQQYIEHCGRFLIAGALYDGIKANGNTLHYTHINGVGFYKTGSKLFQKMLDFLENYIIRNAQFGRLQSAYDYVLRMCVNDYMLGYSTTYHYHYFWRYIHRMIVHTTLITNFAPNFDKHITDSYITDLYDPVIIHQKQ